MPTAVSDAIVAAAAKYRKKSRFPVLSYLDPNTLAALCRCAQPMR